MQAWKDRAKAAESKAKDYDTLKAENDELKRGQMSDAEKAIDDARREGEAAADARHRKTLALADVKVAAAGKLSEQAVADLTVDPDVAFKLLGLDSIPVTGQGDIDSAAIAEAVGTYAKQRPNLAATATGRPGGIDQGAHGDSGGTVDDLDTRIAKAEAEGDWSLATTLKATQVANMPRP